LSSESRMYFTPLSMDLVTSEGAIYPRCVKIRVDDC
jgi:hypothetical protein